MKMIDITGKRFNSLTVLRKSENKNKWGILWVCRCDCGNIIELRSDHVRYDTKTCAECAKKVSVTHNMSKTSEYRIWKLMIRRATKPTATDYARYGAVGRGVCKRWLKFENFIKDMGLRPSPKHSVDRTNNDKGYYPSNCRWATQEEQMNNTSSNVLLEYKGEIKTMKRWADYFNVNYDYLRQRRKKHGAAVLNTILCKAEVGRKLTWKGRTMNISNWSKETGIDIKSIHNRVRMGWGIERIFLEPVNKKKK